MAPGLFKTCVPGGYVQAIFISGTVLVTQNFTTVPGQATFMLLEIVSTGLGATTITACCGLLQNAEPIWVAVTVKVPVCVEVQVCAMPAPVAVAVGDVLIVQLKLPGGDVLKTELQLT